MKNIIDRDKPLKVDISIHNVAFCPVCGGSVWQIRTESHYCFRCGQAITWK